jgi:hypothetical protein
VSGHPDDVTAFASSDVYRVSASAPSGWTTWLPNTLATARFGATVPVSVYVKRDGAAARHTTVNLTVTSESDPTKTATTSCRVV